MKKILQIAAGVVLAIGVFLISIEVSDRWNESRLQANKHRITIGMSEAEVVSILGEPTSKHMSDSPSLFWCYGTDTWDQFDYGDDNCGTVGFEMSPGGGVESMPR